ncbi:hypothetical protein HYH03_016644 [Edaphochlamys debaryana]|uniref:MYND-type domain-containing protein n=1 Tax=Edaphochlamys debaryana TaxID=47281 RepID=A0A836BRF4_9CHLO|nr:hypothetical protein HYH03_016644 [Edaphochlamys debaryana]|eukprot:KAG2484603.1 hypothetical protein HYH03_016644 [Edaphochlamys debaryana]
MPPRQSSAAARKAALEAEEQRRHAAISKLRELGAQALALKDSGQDCSWTPAIVAEAAEAVTQTGGGSAWVAVGEEGRAGLAALFGLALRRSCQAPPPEAAAIPDDLRAAYARLRCKLATALGAIDSGPAAEQIGTDPARLLCVALLKGHLLRGYAALLASATASLEAQRPRPPQTCVQAATALGEELAPLTSLLARLSDVLGTVEIGSTAVEVGAELCDLCTAELAASALFEGWARLALALAACEGGEDASAAQAALMLSALQPLRKSIRPVRGWTSPALLYLLTSHVLALASALDHGTTFGLPLARLAAGAAGPSNAATPAPPAAMVVPLADRDGRRLRPGDTRPAGTGLVREALDMWESAMGDLSRCVKEDYRAWRTTLKLPAGAAIPPPRPPPELWGPRNFEAQALLHTARYAGAAALALLELAVPVASPYSKATCARTAQDITNDCGELGEALAGPTAYLRCCTGFELGMRVAGAAACTLGRGGDLDARSPQELEALYALHEPAQWRQGAQEAQAPGQGQGQGGSQPTVRLRFADAVALGLEGLGLARAALGAPLSVYDPARGAEEVPAWVLRRLQAYWRVVLAWARQEVLAEETGLVELMALSYRPGEAGPPARPGLDVSAALSAGYLPTLERQLRKPTPGPGFRGAVTPLRMSSPGPWAEVAAFAEPAQLASLVSTVVKGLRQARAEGPAGRTMMRDFAAFAAGAFTPGGSLAGAVVQYADRPPAPERWPVAMSTVAAALLPEALVAMMELLSADLNQHKDAPTWQAAKDLVWLVLSWVPTLVAADFPAIDSAPTPAAPAPAAPTPSAAPAPAAPAPAAPTPAAPTPAAPAPAAPTPAAPTPAAPTPAAPTPAAPTPAAPTPAAPTPAAPTPAAPPPAGPGASRATEAAGSSPASAATTGTGAATGKGWSGKMLSKGKGWCGKLLSGTNLSLMLLTSERLIKAEGRCSPLVPSFQAALWALVARAPQLLRSATSMGILRGIQLESMQRVLGVGSAAAEPELLAAVERVLDGGGAGSWAEAGAGGGAGAGTGPSGSEASGAGGGGGKGGGGGTAALPAEVLRYAGAASLLLPYAEALRLRPGCSHPGCTNLAGPSEAALPLKACSGGCGGAARYCSRECQQAHWRDVHKAECQGAARGPAA